jgi:hypothetical protein
MAIDTTTGLSDRIRISNWYRMKFLGPDTCGISNDQLSAGYAYVVSGDSLFLL